MRVRPGKDSKSVKYLSSLRTSLSSQSLPLNNLLSTVAMTTPLRTLIPTSLTRLRSKTHQSFRTKAMTLWSPSISLDFTSLLALEATTLAPSNPITSFGHLMTTADMVHQINASLDNKSLMSEGNRNLSASMVNNLRGQL
jgi:hypothetical protein